MGSRNRDCPIRNKTTKKRIVIPKCRALKGTWIGSWQKCGTTCTRMRQCQAWTFKSGWCSLYDDVQKKCGFTSGRSRYYGRILRLRGLESHPLHLWSQESGELPRAGGGFITNILGPDLNIFLN